MSIEMQEYLASMESAPMGPYNEFGYSNDDIVNVSKDEKGSDDE